MRLFAEPRLDRGRVVVDIQRVASSAAGGGGGPERYLAKAMGPQVERDRAGGGGRQEVSSRAAGPRAELGRMGRTIAEVTAAGKQCEEPRHPETRQGCVPSTLGRAVV